MKKTIFAFLLVTLTSIASAGIIKDKTRFSKVGIVDSFRWAPERYKNDFRYDIFYYIPESIQDSSKVGALIFTHGGGGSTMNREGSIKVVNKYLSGLKKIADELGIIVVLPSSNGLNWGAHTRGLLRDLGRMIKKDLNVDSNRVGVSGHSMGGMGITRDYLWTADEFAFFIPMSSGMDVKIQHEHHLNKVFNVPYVHLQGLNDHFRVFITRCQEQLKRTKDLEVEYNMPSKLQMLFYEGSHNYDHDLFKKTLSELLKNAPRNLYQKELWGSLLTAQTTRVENNITYDYDSEPRYFWVEAIQSDLSTEERIDFHAKIEGNVIRIDVPVKPTMSKGLKIYLHSSMVNLYEKVEVVLNGKLVAKRSPRPALLRKKDARDVGFKFADSIDIKF